MVVNGFLRQANRDMLLISDNIDTLLESMLNYRAREVGKSITKGDV